MMTNDRYLNNTSHNVCENRDFPGHQALQRSENEAINTRFAIGAQIGPKHAFFTVQIRDPKIFFFDLQTIRMYRERSKRPFL